MWHEVFCRNGSAVGGDNGFTEGKAQSQTSSTVSALIVYGIEHIKKLLFGGFRDSGTVVGDRDPSARWAKALADKSGAQIDILSETDHLFSGKLDEFTSLPEKYLF